MHSQLLRFALVGVVGFLVDAGVLTLLLPILGPYGGRLISFACAVVATWLLNRRFTFEAQSSHFSPRAEFARYFSAMIVGGSANYLTYALLIFASTQVAQMPILGVAAGSVVGLALNFMLAKNWIFVTRR